MIRRCVALEDKGIFDISCGIGTYLGQFQRFSPCVYGIDLDRERAHEAGRNLPHIAVAQEYPYNQGR